MLDYFRTFSARYEPVAQAKAATMSPAFAATPHDPKSLKRKRSHDHHASPSNPTPPSTMAQSQDNSSISTPPLVTQQATSNASQQRPVAGSKSLSGSSSAHDNKDTRTNATPAEANGKGLEPDVSTPVSESAVTVNQEMRDEQCKAARQPNVSALRDTIESQFNLEILLKHRELRLIDQELAKCEVAYEQLRRCQAIPFPAQSTSHEAMLASSAGEGPTHGNTATDAAPWGVTDGPYSRHYQTWLLPSSRFDDDVIEPAATAPQAGKRLPDRLTRGVNAEKGIYPLQSRSQRGSGSSRSKSLPQAYPEPKEEKGPMVVPRKSDGRLVKLICLDCRRSNFNSVQGFINHCRIAHNRLFVSHEAAIEASGEVFDSDADVTTTPEANTSRNPPGAGLVHPMIRSARPLTPEPRSPSTPLSSTTQQDNPSTNDQTVPASKNARPRVKQRGGMTMSSTFQPSPRTPHLSKLLAELGNGEDLEDLVADAKKRDEIEAIEAMDIEESSDEEIEDPASLSRSTRGVAQCSVRPASASSSKPMISAQPPSRHDSSQQAPTSSLPALVKPPSYQSAYISNERTKSDDSEHQSTDLLSPSNLSPNSTDPHPAPSLVSDDGDFYNTHSESDSGSHMDLDEDEDHYLHPRFFDHDEIDMEHADELGFPDHAKAHNMPGRGRPSAGTAARSEQRHVTFASPIRTDKAKSKGRRA